MKKPSVSGKSASARSKSLLRLLVRALDDKKAGDLQVLDVSRQSSITDFLILATGTSEPHLRALRIEMERVLDEQRAPIIGIDTSKGSGWTVVDAFDVMVHLFAAENRAKYGLESLWKDAKPVAVGSLLAKT